MPDLSPITSLFLQFVADLPPGSVKVLAGLFIALGFGALLTLKTKDRLKLSDCFIWWDDNY
jgi:hypothetical protein